MTAPENAVAPRSGALPTIAAPTEVADRLAATDPVNVLPRQLLLSQERAAWLGERLRDQVEREGVAGVVGTSYSLNLDGRAVVVGEFTRSLAEQERAERQHTAVLAERCHRLGISDGVQARDSDVAQAIARGMKALLVELGMDPDDPDVLQTSKRAFARTWQERQGQAWTPSQQRAYFGEAGMPNAGPTQ